MNKKQLEDFIRKNPRKTFTLYVPIIAAMLVAVPISCDMRAEQHKKEEQARTAKEQAEEEKKLAEYKAVKEAEQRQEHEARATEMGISYEEFIKAKDDFSGAYFLCTAQVKKMAQWGAKQDTLPKVKWEMRKGHMIITGRDIKMKNAFNAERYVKYVCVYDPVKETLEVLSIE